LERRREVSAEDVSAEDEDEAAEAEDETADEK
jgi:hypothetical protein